jgi:geranylgeranyl diphosphate synthase type II
MDIKIELKRKQEYIDKALNQFLPQSSSHQSIIFESMRYSVFAGGKRLRPILMLAACEFVNGSIEKALPFACAIELIHTYSLIHDDLPAMDNDDYRRGKPTNHKVYGDGIAILTGDGLLNYAFELMLDTVVQSDNNITYYKNQILAIQEIASAAGIYGMIGGQIVDLISENKKIDSEILEFIHQKKTAAMIIASIKAGALLGNGSDKEIYCLTEYAKNIGLGFQIKDDILDIRGDEKKLGKKIGSDLKNQKATYPALFGLDSSIKKVNEFFKKSISAIESYGKKAQFLIGLAEHLTKRES